VLARPAHVVAGPVPLSCEAYAILHGDGQPSEDGGGGGSARWPHRARGVARVVSEMRRIGSEEERKWQG